MRPLGWLIAATVFAGCPSPRPATQVTVYVDAQPLVRAETSEVILVVRGGPADSPVLAVREERRVSEPAWPIDMTLVPVGGDASRLFEVEATARDVTGALVAQVRLRSGFVAGRAREVRLVLEDRCRGVDCGPKRTCRAGTCVEPDEPDPTDGLDGGVDGGGGGRCSADAECDDRNPCNGIERCVEGTCRFGERLVCDDRVDCTVDRCEPSGCVNVPDDGACTRAAGGRCDPVHGCQYPTCDSSTCVSDGCFEARCRGSLCERVARCGEGETCCDGRCVATRCEDGNPCTMDFLDRTSCRCASRPLTGVECSDGNACTPGDACRVGVCEPGGGTLECVDDGNPCTLEQCDPSRGCVSQPRTGAACDDRNACTERDGCQVDGSCQGVVRSCGDGIDCTDDRCDPGSGCVNAPNDARCGPGFRCDPVMRGCVSTVMGCDPAECAMTAGPCEVATCSGGACVRRTVCMGPQICCGGTCTTCDDGNPCTADRCVGGTCASVPTAGSPCDDGDPCTHSDRCQSDGRCAGTAVTCMDDGNPCTVESCIGGRCQSVNGTDGTLCDDGNACTGSDTCRGGRCTGEVLRCDDRNVCTSDSCDPASGCSFTPRDGERCGGRTADCEDLLCSGDLCVPHFACDAGQICEMGRCRDPGPCPPAC
ncbi:MAG: hypothetical protein NZ898_12440 [Myxococcota bacterium]|nr:hypothetical protein [Myxococcota bacterium]MDW8361372.1 hypothetical protein [Myxococcales bacterium]